MWSHTWIVIFFGWAVYSFLDTAPEPELSTGSLKSYYNMHIIEKTEHFSFEKSKTNATHLQHELQTTSWL